MTFFDYFNLEKIETNEELKNIIDSKIEELSSFRRLDHKEMLGSSSIIEQLILLKHNLISQLDFELPNNKFFILSLLDICEMAQYACSHAYFISINKEPMGFPLIVGWRPGLVLYIPNLQMRMK